MLRHEERERRLDGRGDKPGDRSRLIAARSFRPLWMLEELGLTYDLKMLPFPPRVFAKEYMAVEPARHGAILDRRRNPDDRNRPPSVTISAPATVPTPLVVGVEEAAYGAFLNWMYFSDATLTFPQTLVLRYGRLEPEERRSPQVAGRLRQVVLRPAARGRSGDRRHRRAVRRSFHGGRYRHRLCATACRQASGLRKISVRMLPPIGSACRRARGSSGRSQRKISPRRNKISPGVSNPCRPAERGLIRSSAGLIGA